MFLDNRVSHEHQLSKSSPPTPKIFSIWEVITQHKVSSNLKNIFQGSIEDFKVAHAGENVAENSQFLEMREIVVFHWINFELRGPYVNILGIGAELFES